MIDDQPERVTLTVGAACKATGVGRTYLYELIRDGRVKSVKLGRRRLIVASSLRDLIAGASS